MCVIEFICVCIYRERDRERERLHVSYHMLLYCRWHSTLLSFRGLTDSRMPSSEGPLRVVLSTQLKARHNSACLRAHPGAPRGTNSSRDGCFDAATDSRSHETGGANTKVLCPPAGAPSSEHFTPAAQESQ